MPAMKGSAGLSLEFAATLADIAPEKLTAADITQLQRLVLDHTAVTLCGSVQPWGRKLTKWAAEHGDSGRAVLVGSGRAANAATAGLVNGTSAHGYELDDTHEASRSHPGAVVITAALAVGAERKASGREVLAAIVAGYEAMTRLGMASGALEVTQAGFHATCLFGPFGAAAAAGKLLGLNGDQIAQAWGIALSMTGGASQFAFEPKGTMVKRMHAGIPAQHGIIAAQLASLGVAGPVQAFEGENGFFHLFGQDPDPAALLRRTDEPLQIHAMSFKPYSCCRKFHSLIDGLQAATDDFRLDTHAIEKITVFSPRGSIEKHMMRRPDSVMAAQYSMPYIVGATLAHGPRRYDAYGEAHHGDKKILDIVDRVDAVYDADLDRYVPRAMPNRVTLHMRDGTERTETVVESLGSPERPLAMEDVIAKAEALVELTGEIDLNCIIAAVETLPEMEDINGLMQSLAIRGYDELAGNDRAA
jgi:2-methylcitrate dehydratase PrpD